MPSVDTTSVVNVALVVMTGLVTAAAGVFLFQDQTLIMYQGTTAVVYQGLLLCLVGLFPLLVFTAETAFAKLIGIYQLSVAAIVPGLVVTTSYTLPPATLIGLAVGVGCALIFLAGLRSVVDPIVCIWLLSIMSYIVTISGILMASTSTLGLREIPLYLYVTLILGVLFQAYFNERRVTMLAHS
jgi:hypothetical protein